MTTNRAAKNGWRTWKPLLAQQMPADFADKFNSNRPFQESLAAGFSLIAEGVARLGEFTHVAHFFVNQNLPEANILYLKIDDNTSNYYKKFTHLTSEHHTVLVNHSRLGPDDPAPNADHIQEILRIIEARSEIHHPAIVSFNYGQANLGFFLLWNENPRHRPCSLSNDEFKRWLAQLYTAANGLLRRQFGVETGTYLPSYRAERWDRAAVMFCDIRNASGLMRIIRDSRLPNKRNVLQEIMNIHCNEMGGIIKEYGRVDKFMGDGLMALFGEYTPIDEAKVCRAVMAATEMVNRFSSLKSEFEQMAFDNVDYRKDHNESVAIDLGIGINLGTVLFTYLGHDTYKEFTAVGDHINFAQRLETQAARRNAITGKINPPILLSYTAKEACSKWLKRFEKLELALPGHGTYEVFGIYSEDFAHDLFEQTDRRWRAGISPVY